MSQCKPFFGGRGQSAVLVPAFFSAILLAAAPLTAQDDSATHHARELSRAFRGAAERAIPSVVTVIGKVRPRWNSRERDLRELLDEGDLRGLLPEEALPPAPLGGDLGETESQFPAIDSQLGSGIIVEDSGRILTNHHVVSEADEVVVRFSDGLELPARRIHGDALSDIALLQVNLPEEVSVSPAQLGDSDQLEIGDWVIAIGSPFELEATVSAGIISGKGRSIDKIRRGSLLQTDAAINPGNSGGPLVNLDGQVVGLNTAIASSSGGYQGIGFAIPINRAKWVIDELLTHGHVRRAYLGIHIDEVTTLEARRLGTTTRAGVLVTDVMDDGPAARAGMQPDDVILAFDGKPVQHPRDLQDIVEQSGVGTRRPVRVWRDGEMLTLGVELQSLPEEIRSPGRSRP